MSARSVMFYTVVAEQLGLGVSDLRAWDLLLKDGPIMASRFAELTGLILAPSLVWSTGWLRPAWSSVRPTSMIGAR